MAIVMYDEQPTAENYDETGFSEKIEAALKVIALFSFALIFGGFLLTRSLTKSQITKTSIKSSFGKVEYKTPYKNTLYQNFGFVQEPKIELPMKTTSGYVDTTFLLDSGAVVSALPLQAARDTGINLATAKRITLRGFSGVPTFAYLGNITVKIGSEDYEFPAVFTESESTTYILGRKGLFDDFTIEFDNTLRVITISNKE